MLFSKGYKRTSYLLRLRNVSSMLRPSHFCVLSFNRDNRLQIQWRCLLWLSNPLPSLWSSFSSWALFYSKLQQSSGSCYTIDVYLPALPLDRQGGGSIQPCKVSVFFGCHSGPSRPQLPILHGGWQFGHQDQRHHSGTPRTRSFIPVPSLVNICPQLR